MQQNFQKMKLYALVLAGAALISMMLPWLRIEFLGSGRSWNGFNGWGILSLAGIAGVAALSLMGNKMEPYTSDQKKYVMISFGAIALGALLFFLRMSSVSGGVPSDLLKSGIGLWICLIAGLAGLGLLLGFIKVETKSARGGS